MAVANLGANEFTFIGHGTRITYFPRAPGPIQPGQEGGRLEYRGVEGHRIFNGNEIRQMDSPLGILLTVVLRPQGDGGGLTATVPLSRIDGVEQDNPVELETVLVKTASLGNLIPTSGPELTYTVIHLRGTAKDVILPLSQTNPTGQPTSPPT
jgi:hypothetical protein